LLQDLKVRGYQIHLFFLWLPSVDIALERIADRVRRGGHNILAEVVRRRFKRGLPNLFQIYRPLVDFWAIIDNSTDTPKLIAYEKGKELKIVKKDIFPLITKSVETP
jgi:predicted ABC-type ATPase